MSSWWSSATSALAESLAQLQDVATTAVGALEESLGLQDEHKAGDPQSKAGDNVAVGITDAFSTSASTSGDTRASGGTPKTANHADESNKAKRAEELAKTPLLWDIPKHLLESVDPSADPDVALAVSQTLERTLRSQITMLAGTGKSVASSFLTAHLTPEAKIEESPDHANGLSSHSFNYQKTELLAAKALRNDPNLAGLYYLSVPPGGLKVRHVRPQNYDELAEVLLKECESIPITARSTDALGGHQVSCSTAPSDTDASINFFYRTIPEKLFWSLYFRRVNEIRQSHGLPAFDVFEEQRSNDRSSEACALGEHGQSSESCPSEKPPTPIMDRLNPTLAQSDFSSSSCSFISSSSPPSSTVASSSSSKPIPAKPTSTLELLSAIDEFLKDMPKDIQRGHLRERDATTQSSAASEGSQNPAGDGSGVTDPGRADGADGTDGTDRTDRTDRTDEADGAALSEVEAAHSRAINNSGGCIPPSELAAKYARNTRAESGLNWPDFMKELNEFELWLGTSVSNNVE